LQDAVDILLQPVKNLSDRNVNEGQHSFPPKVGSAG